MTDASGPSTSPKKTTDESEIEDSEQTAGAGGNNPARPSETGGNSIEVGDQIQDLLES